jgi:hypothetical protein
MKKIALTLVILATWGISASFGQQVRVRLTHDASFTNIYVINTMQQNLSKVLTEINTAQQMNRPLNVALLPANDMAKKTLTELWANIHFYCDDPQVIERVWNFSNGYMVRQVPLIITPTKETFGAGTFQEAIVYFDRNGTITDFLFSSDIMNGESLEKGGDPVDIERKMKILQYVERFRTAYNTKDMNFMNQIFSEDALIITGSVITTRPSSMAAPVSSVRYKKQNKQEYLANLKKAFDRNSWIQVKFDQIGDHGETGAEKGITQSINNPNMYGVRLRQEWHSSTYHDIGYIFLLWDFTDENAPVIHVRTWQPEWVGDKKLQPEQVFSLEDWNL